METPLYAPVIANMVHQKFFGRRVEEPGYSLGELPDIGRSIAKFEMGLKPAVKTSPFGKVYFGTIRRVTSQNEEAHKVILSYRHAVSHSRTSGILQMKFSTGEKGRELKQSPLESCWIEQKSPVILCFSTMLIQQQELFSERLDDALRATNLPELAKLRKLNIISVKKEIDDLVNLYIREQNLEGAREVLKIACSLFQESEDYRRIARVISPPKLVGIRRARIEDRQLGKNISILKRLGKEYPNKWVAVLRGQLIGVSDSYKELLDKHKDEEDVIITQMS